MQSHLSLVASQGALNFCGALGLVGVQETCVTASHFGNLIRAPWRHVRPPPTEPRPALAPYLAQVRNPAKTSLRAGGKKLR